MFFIFLFRMCQVCLIKKLRATFKTGVDNYFLNISFLNIKIEFEITCLR